MGRRREEKKKIFISCYQCTSCPTGEKEKERSGREGGNEGCIALLQFQPVYQKREGEHEKGRKEEFRVGYSCDLPLSGGGEGARKKEKDKW